MLIIEDAMVYQATEDIPDNASDFYIQVPEVFLSKPYELVTGDRLWVESPKFKKRKRFRSLKTSILP